MKIIFATGNKNKIKEIKAIFADTDFEVLSMHEIGLFMNIEETGKTFEENSLLKARALLERITADDPVHEDCIVMADDSGFMVDYLDGEPGVYSARYLGEDASDEEKCAGILERMKDVKEPAKRSCCFRAVITAVLPSLEVIVTTGEMRGSVAFAPRGAKGFGYDPILYIPELDKTASELSMEEKNAISHRGLALEAMKKELAKRM